MHNFKQLCLLFFCFGGKDQLTYNSNISKHPLIIQKAIIKINLHKQLGLLCG